MAGSRFIRCRRKSRIMCSRTGKLRWVYFWKLVVM